ncbi:LytR/AlgR family response regulator transcription factor [Solitalea canadensis]|uniref:Response regulator of the LytR/AlgR family n=1 Tax=Solitalea canadensis (strain ATCC 29591 / DSM 3403 / JCM 21819 / LMG 8368 / NBRC 15130 / NCIMB 12057 / USAM 9D) TaxID=929556 RepID=H8KT61_SOLCM|nr:LytTR family DNA-binding domain-containing protein [Solitalea canadensis]AFD05244.1 response regulator of the LytR/AlgR family [Solitalea canadensis DSM 3403]
MITENKIQCLIVDDEPPAIAILQKYIESVPGLMLTGACFNAVEALTVLQQKNVDLLFLDIQMPQLLGTDFIRTLKNPPKVIFTTAYRKYAVEGFELDAVDYLLKPVSFERFIKAVNKVMQTQVQPAGEPVEISDGSKDGAFIYFRADRKMVKVFLKDILYVESLKDYIKVITSFRQIITKQSISSLEAMLPANQFVRIHRSYLVAISKIDSFTADDIEIQKKEIPIGRMYQHEVNRVLKLAVK